MPGLNRICCLFLTIVLAVGIVSLAAHSARHAGLGVEQCLVCASQLDQDNLLALQSHHAIAIADGQTPNDFLPARASVSDCSRRFRARAPPTAI